MPSIRPYRPADAEAVADVCVRTGVNGADARGVYRDPTVLPAIFAAPYAYLEPELAFVLDDAGTAVGYVWGTADTATFVRRFRAEWLPLVGDRYPHLTTRPTTPDEDMANILHTPELLVVAEVPGYPAHLHMNLLPAHRRRGHGRALVETLLAALRGSGVPALHVGVPTANLAPRLVFGRLGFHPVDVAEPGPLTYLGLALSG